MRLVAASDEQLFGTWRASRRVVLLSGGYFAVLAIGFGGCGVWATVRFFPVGAVFLPLFGPLAYSLARAAWRIPSSRVEIGSDGVLVVGPLRTWRLPLTDVTEFRAVIAAGNNGQPTIELVSRRRRPIRLWIFNRNGFVWQMRRLAQNLEPDAGALNQALTAARRGC